MLPGANVSNLSGWPCHRPRDGRDTEGHVRAITERWLKVAMLASKLKKTAS